MPNIEMNATQTLAELEKIKQKVLQVENTIKTANSNASISTNNYTNMLNVTSLAESARAVATDQSSNSTINNAVVTGGAISQLGLLSAELNNASSALNSYGMAWNFASASIGLHNLNLTLNTNSLMQNMNAIMQHTIALTADTAMLNINSISVAFSTLMNQLNAMALSSVNTELVNQFENLNNSTKALINNSIATLINALLNLGNWFATSLLNKETSKYSETIAAISETLKNNNKLTLINILTNLGNWLATKVLNKESDKRLQLTRQQTISQNLLNGALAAAAILTNPLIGAITVAGAALAQGLMSGQKTEPVGISMSGSQKSVEKETSITEVLSSNSSSGGLSNSLTMVDTDKISSKNHQITGIASLTNGGPQKLAKGGVVRKPTIAMIGEGKYDEAVIPLGNSPQMRNLKADIANAVVQSLMAMKAMESTKNNGIKDTQAVALYLDGQKMAELLLPRLLTEQKKKTNIKLVGA